MEFPSRLLPLIFGLILAGSAAAAPTLTNITTISGPDVQEDAAIPISYDRLAAAANESGDTTSFRRKTLFAGTLTKNGENVPLNGTLGVGETWIWTPPANQNGNNFVAFSVVAFAAGEESASGEIVRFDVTAVPDAPVLGGAILGTLATPLTDVGTDSADPSYLIFGNLTISDADSDNQSVVVTISKEADDYGSFELPGANVTDSVDQTSRIHTLSFRSPANAQTALRLGKYTVNRNRVPVALRDFAIEVKVIDTTLLQDTESSTVHVRSVNDAPVVTATITPAAVPDTASVAPFQLTLTDPDVGETFEVTLAETSATPRGTLSPANFSVTGDAAAVAAGVGGVSYLPAQQSNNVTATFRHSIVQIHPSGVREDAVTADRNLSIQFINDATELAGLTVALIRTTDDPSEAKVFPFSTVTVNDPDPGQTFTVTIALDDPAKGSFVKGDGTSLGSITGTAAAITALLRDVVFVPAPNRIAVNQSETATITLTIADTSSSPLTRVNNQTQIEVTAVNGAPRVLWTLASDDRFPTSDEPAQIDPTPFPLPFAPVEFKDDSELTVTITIDDPDKGVLGTVAGSGFQPTSAGSGVYVFSGDEDEATTAIQGLKFIVNPDFIFPPDLPGRTDFTIKAEDAALNRTVRVLPIVLVSESRSFMVTQLIDDESVVGSLRNAIAAAADNDVIVFALPSYPATIRLTEGPLVLNKHLSFRGPGADKLAISGDSNANLLADAADTRLFEVFTRVRMSGLRLERGYAAAGGAIAVARREPGLRPGELVLEDCTIARCVATQWGGAVDVFEGSLRAERCLFEGNSLLASSGQGGGAVSLFTELPCFFINCTFSGNSQSSPVGLGGGGIYAENHEPSRPFDVTVTHCTFSGNLDASNKGSSIHSNVANTRVRVTNSIFADFTGRNLGVSGAGEILSGGGNLSNDNTATTSIQGGVPQLATLLNNTTGTKPDQRNIDPKLGPLDFVEGRVKAHRLLAGSPATDAAVSGKAAVDQRGVVRLSPPDSGALGTDRPGRLVIHEIRTAAPQFIELFNPRDQATLQLNGCELWIDGERLHTFGSADKILSGSGLIVASGALATLDSSVPVIVPLALNPRGRIEIRRPSGITLTSPQPPSEQTLLAGVSYVSVFAQAFTDPATTPAVTVGYGNDSITLAPQLGGTAFVPHRLVLPPPAGVNPVGTGPAASPGGYSLTTPFGLPNAFPFAALDRFEVTEDELATLNVLANDLDPDGADRVFLVDLNPALSGTPPASNKSSILTNAGAAVSMTPATAPLRGTALGFDPRTAFNHLPAGARVTDTFAYSVIDVGSGAVGGYADGLAGTTLVTALSHRLSSGETVVISGSATAAYNVSRAVTVVDADTFRIPVTFAGNPGPLERGSWQTAVPRSPSARSEALVEVTVLGRNDPPTPAANTVAVNEDTVLRIFGDPVAAAPVLDTDGLYPVPRTFNGTGLLANDSDPDTNDQPFTKLRVVGVCQARAIGGFSGSPGQSPVTVTSTAHGLEDGTTVLVSGYGGHPSYNGYHLATVTGANTFTLPLAYFDNAATKGLWTVLNDSNRLATTSFHGAAVSLEIRANRAQTNVVFNPRPSTLLNGLANGESANDTFHYAVEDQAGAVSLAPVTVNVGGVNDAPVPSDNPPGLAVLTPLLPPGQSLAQFTAASEVLYMLPSGGSPGTVNAALRPPGGGPDDVVVVAGIDWTHEDAPLALASAGLLANDQDVDRSDLLRFEIGAGQNLSREGAAISLGAGGSLLNYNPTAAPKLQALAFKERVIDTFVVTVFDGIARVNTTIAVLVEGRNDQPIASNTGLTTPEKTFLEVKPPGLLLSGLEIDQNTRLPDNRKFLLPTRDFATTVFGAKVNVLLEAREGVVNDFAAGAPGTTVVLSPGHGLQTGQEVVLPASGPLTGQYVLTRIDADRFSVPVAYDAAFSSVGGIWQVLASTLQYDPTASVFPGPTGGPAFTLQGLGQGQSYVDTFTYTLLDGSYLFANDDIYRVEVDRGEIELRVLDNDTNLDGVAVGRRIIAVGPPSGGGSVALNGDESILYTPETSFVGDEVFTYTIEDDLGNRDTALVTARVTVDRLNGNLRANADRFTVAAGQGPLLDVLANDSIIPATGAPLALAGISTAPDQGGTAVIENGRIRYTPSAAAVVFPYTENFAYTMSGGGTATASAVVTVVVVNRANTLNVRADSFGVPAGSSEVTLNVLENDNILPGTGEDLVITAVGTPLHGTVTIVDGVALAYSPAAAFLGTDTFSYTVGDGFGGTGVAQVTVKVGYLTTNTDIFSVRFDDPGKTVDDGFTTLDVLANDNVLQGGAGAVTLTAVTPLSPALGQMSVAPDGKSLRFDPAVGATGQLDFTYTITDVGGRSATGTVTVVVIASGIRASSDFFTVQTDSQSNELGVLSNDLRISDLPGQLSVTSIGIGVDGPDQGGSVEISEDFKKLVYTPAPGFRGTESFTYTVTDGDSTDTARVSVRSTIGEMVAGEDEFFVYRGSDDNRLAVLGNDRIIPDGGQLLVITAISNDPGNPSNPLNRGSLAIIEDGAALSYTPSPANTVFPYVETFTYEISSGGTARAAGVIRIEVLDRIGARNLETNHDVFAVRSDSPGTVLPVLANDSVLPASAADWIITEVSVPTSNVCSPFLTADFLAPRALATTLAAQGGPLAQFLWARFTPASRALFANPAASELQLRVALVSEFNGVVRAGTSIHDPARFAGITLREATQTLLAQGATGEQLIVLNRLLLEDAFPAGLRQAAGGGSVAIVGTDLIYVPQPGYVGSVRFTYRVSDRLGGTGFGEVTVKVGDVSVSDDVFTVLAGGGPVALDVTANDGILRTSFPAAQQAAQADFTLTALKAITIVPPAAGSAVVAGEVVSFTPAAGFQGKATLTYWVEDDGGCTFPGTAVISVMPPGGDRDTAVASITVTGINDPPQLLGVGPTATSDTNPLQPFANATVVEFDEQRQQLVTLTITYPAGQGVLGGGFTVLSPGVLRFQGTAAQVTAALRALVFTPVPNRIPIGQTENTAFTLSLDDGFVASPVIIAPAVTTVTPVNDLPVITGTVAAQKLYQFSSLRPFAGVNITDIDNLGAQPQTFEVRIDNAIKGGFSNLGGFVQQPAGSGIYLFTGAPAAASTALRGLLFTPSPGNRVTPVSPEVAGFTITITDGFGPPVVDAVTSVQILHGEVDRLLSLGTTGLDVSQIAAAFGTAVAISGDTLVVGSPLRDLPAVDAGRVFVYERNAGFGAPWGQVAQVAGSDTVAGDRFGESVSIDGNFMVVGAPGADAAASNAGAAYVFQRNPGNPNAWTQVAKLLPPLTNGAGNDAFGTAVAIQGNTILAGAPNANLPGAPRSGRVFAYRSAAGAWSHVQTLVAADNRTTGIAGDNEDFGFSLAFDGNTAVIGSHGANLGGQTSQWNYGAAYIFTRGGSELPWAEIKRLDEFADPTATSNSGFGYAVDISGDRIVVGVHSGNSPFGVFKPGGARIYERDFNGTNQWGEVERISPADGIPSDYFATSVAISGDLVLIGSPGPGQASTVVRGYMEVHRRASSAPVWSLIDRLPPGADTAFDRFGQAVAIDGFTGVSGAPGDSVNLLGATTAGSARVYQFQYDLGPRLALPVPDQLARQDTPFQFAVNPATFNDPIYPGPLTLSVALSNGSPLPAGAWLTFNPATATFAGTPVAANRGDYMLVLTATNPLGSKRVSNPFLISVSGGGLDSAYAAWAAGQFTPAELADPALEASVWGMNANPEGDSQSNLLEMLFGLNPKLSDQADLVFTRLSSTLSTLNFPRSTAFPADEAEVEWSTDLLTWSTTGVGLTPAAAVGGIERVTAVITSPVPRTRLFVRIVAGE